ncbi:histidine phosphatase family protein [Nakamurella lactea]|uniref:histidine phosphatase family protein n=1 Tax=Nakamurella lactea TaxID=459515 RepID=UPI0003FA3290|nr:histidine phosphatase family protein [Nakamurella lactea]
MAARIALIRHGETEWSAAGRHTSITDIDLTAHGERQAAALPATLEAVGISPVTVFCSPRRRSRRTAELAQLTVTETVDDLAEWNYGELEGENSDAVRERLPHWSVFTDGAPGGESPERVGARAVRVLQLAERELVKGDVVLVGHGHFSRVLAARWAGLPVSAGSLLLIDPGSVSVLGYYHRDRAIAQLNVPSGLHGNG